MQCLACHTVSIILFSLAFICLLGSSLLRLSHNFTTKTLEKNSTLNSPPSSTLKFINLTTKRPHAYLQHSLAVHRQIVRVNPPRLLVPGMPGISERNSLAMGKQIEKMLSEVRKAYQAKMKQLIECQLTGMCFPRLEVNVCQNLDAYCGGLGDRMFWLTNQFYHAFATNSIFIINMTKPVPMTEFFDLNEALYGIRDFESVMPKIHKLQENFKPKIPQTAMPSTLDEVFSKQKELNELIKIMQKYYIDPVTLKPMPLHYEMIYFVALNIIFSKPKGDLKNAIEDTLKKIDGLGGYESQKCRIGVHIRTNPTGMYKRKNVDYPRLSKKQLKSCYFEKVVNVSRNCSETKTGQQPTPVVYIASDSVEAKTWMTQNLQKKGIKVIASNYTAVQLDIDFTNRSLEYRYQAFLSTLIDWVMLTKMNELVIPRSGFSEFASTFSSLLPYRRPTHRLPPCFSQNCSFEYDYYRKFPKLERSHPQGIFKQDEFNS